MHFWLLNKNCFYLMITIIILIEKKKDNQMTIHKISFYTKGQYGL
ncbi:transposase [Aggregatibacter segnis ATCC 33393]|uniref:Transposase n=1 Tax=Aggregatibacter segnis ATCC 33393 TaxID=888057 RepID=E6KZE4_9PAST|nr:transposase [Aggregatibacter segnis ATCC 33393]